MSCRFDRQMDPLGTAPARDQPTFPISACRPAHHRSVKGTTPVRSRDEGGYTCRSIGAPIGAPVCRSSTLCLNLSVSRLLRPTGGRVLKVLLSPIRCRVEQAV